MKKLLVITLVVALALGLSTAIGFTRTEIVGHVINTGGTTHFYEFATVGGYDYSECPRSFQVTGFVDERIDNTGTLYIDKYVMSPGPWEMVEVKNVWATGVTCIYKDAVFWTEDRTIDCSTGLLRWPTEAAVVWDYQNTDNPTVTDFEYARFLLDIPSAQHGDDPGNYAVFEKSLWTDESLYFEEKVGINIYLGKGVPDIPDPCVPGDC